MTHLAIQEYIRPLLLAQVDTVVLACTHFPLLKDLIEKALGPTIQVIDPAFATAQAVKKTLLELNLLCDEKKQAEPLFCVTDDPEKFESLGPHFFGHSIAQVKLCEPDKFIFF